MRSARPMKTPRRQAKRKDLKASGSTATGLQGSAGLDGERTTRELALRHTAQVLWIMGVSKARTICGLFRAYAEIGFDVDNAVGKGLVQSIHNIAVSIIHGHQQYEPGG